LSVSAIGADRPGIVAGVTGVLVEHGCNLEDTSMTILRGHFAMTMVVDSPVPGDVLAGALEPVADRLGLVVDVREIAPAAAQPRSGRPHVVSVHGADHPGIVHAVAATLAKRGVNVTDLTTHLVGEPEPLYVMTLDVDVPADVDEADLAADLRSTAESLGVTATLHAVDADLL
ncbi:MAG TPA: ACT domain-containing protein, partial [Mycobacteriales bacterium]|nr:ACT domain-containing protein [Mycobacteriales bacterium]